MSRAKRCPRRRLNVLQLRQEVVRMTMWDNWSTPEEASQGQAALGFGGHRIRR